MKLWPWSGAVEVLFVFGAGRLPESFCLSEILPILIARGQGDGVQGSYLRNAGKLPIEEAFDGFDGEFQCGPDSFDGKYKTL
jgi:hypothetical protein